MKNKNMKLSVEYLIPKYQDNLYQAAFSVLQNPADAQDAVQTTMIRYHYLNQEFEDEEHIRKWLFKTVINASKDIRRSFWRRNKVSLEETMASIEFERIQDQSLFQEVCSLPEKYRIVIQLFYYEEFTIQEISQLLSITQSNVKKRLSRARDKLRNVLEQEDEHVN
ncbi:RNA polymerase sigma factor [Ileibacterium valens]|nr:sigma-70 family RNA polymerase sigma factor [Ileibacterium valens]